MFTWPEATLMRLLAAAGIFLVAAVYLRGWRRLPRPALPPASGRATDPASTRSLLLCLSGLALLAVAFISPLGYLATQYFSARIVQHMLVVASVPSLLMFANPAPALVYGLPARAREATLAALRRPADAASGRLRRALHWACLLYTSPSPRDRTRSRMPSSA